MQRSHLALFTAVAGSLSLHSPLLAQDEESDDPTAVYEEFDGDISDDAIDVDTGDDEVGDRIAIVDEDGDPSWDDDLDEDGDDIDDSDERPFQDSLPVVYDLADSEAVPEARKNPALAPFGGIFNGAEVRSLISGFKVKNGAAPFVVQIRYSSDPRKWASGWLPEELWMAKHVCGGSVIASQWVITAAHCVNKHHFSLGLEVVIGSLNLANSTSGRTVPVDRVVLHKGYLDGDIYNEDIALIHLASPAGVTPVARHSGAMPAVGAWLSTVGWGKTNRVAEQWASAAMFRADVQLLDSDKCDDIVGYVGRINETVLCGGGSSSKACTGDSGGPVVLTNGDRPVLIGIVSWFRRDSCEQLDAPGVYTKVSAYKEWINRAMAVTARGVSTIF